MSKKENKKEDTRKRIPVHRYAEKDKVYEAVFLGSTPVFLSYSRDGKWKLQGNIEELEFVIVPVPKEGLAYRPYRLTKKMQKQLVEGNYNYKSNKQELFDKILDQIKLYIDVSDEDQILFAAEIFETYIQHKLSAVGYLFLEGEPGTGKTNACIVISNLSYRTMYSADTNAANIYEYVGCKEENEAQMTIVEDEVDWIRVEKNVARKMKIYRVGYKQGAVVPRILNGSKSSRQMKFYRAFCSKVFSGYGFPKDPAFVQRCIPAMFVDGNPVRDEITREDRKVFDKIKTELLLWRMYHYFDPLPEFSYPKIRKRNKEVWKCKILALDGVEEQETIVEMAHKNVKEKIEIKSTSFEAYVVRAVKIQAEETWGWKEIPFTNIWRQLLKDLDIEIVDAYINPATKIYSEELQTEISGGDVGRTLNALLHGKPKLKRIELEQGEGRKPHRVWSFDKEKVLRLFESYKQQEEKIDDNEEGYIVDVVEDLEEEEVWTGEEDI